MPTPNPIQQGAVPVPRESSPLRSPRDSDNTTRQWRKQAEVAGHVIGLGQNVAQLQRQLNRLRRPASSQEVPLSPYVIVSVEDEFLVCHAWDYSAVPGEEEGTEDVLIALPYKLRRTLLEQTIFGDLYNYEYAPGPDTANQYRTKKKTGSADELQLVVPPWCPGEDIVYAVPAVTGVFDELDPDNPVPVELLLFGDSRQWAKV